MPITTEREADALKRAYDASAIPGGMCYPYDAGVYRPPIICCFGGGVNSTALLIAWVERGLPLDHVTFADTGGERPHTYKHVEQVSEWLEEHGYPPVTTVQYHTREGKRLTLEQNCRDKEMLPSLAYGYKKCSLRFKVRPQDKHLRGQADVSEAWEKGFKPVKLLGYDAEESHRVERASREDDKYEYVWPLAGWGLRRQECNQLIRETGGLCNPGKSACFFCPAHKKGELRQLKKRYPALAERAAAMEQAAQKNLDTVAGLGRRFRWTDFWNADEQQQALFPNRSGGTEGCMCWD